MYENRSITAIIIGVVSLMLIGAAWFYLGRKPASSAGPAPTRRTDPYSGYMRDVGQIADSLATPTPTPANSAGTAAAPAGQPAAPQANPGQPVNGQTPTEQPIPAPPTAGQPAPAQPAPGQPAPGQPVPAQPAPGLVPASQPGLQAPALPPDMPPPTMLRR